MHKLTLRYASHTIPILSPMLFIPTLYYPILNLNLLVPLLFMHACMYEPSVFVVVVYKHVIHVRHHYIPYKALCKV